MSFVICHSSFVLIKGVGAGLGTFLSPLMIRFIQNPPFYVLSKKDSILLIKGVGAGLGTFFSLSMIKFIQNPPFYVLSLMLVRAGFATYIIGGIQD